MQAGAVTAADRGNRVDDWTMCAGLSSALGLDGADPGGQPEAAPVQRKALDSSGPGMGSERSERSDIAFPHAGTIQSSTGLSVPGTAVLDAAGCEARGVPSFTDGTSTHFASETVSLHVAAHEATHQFQHAGLSRDGGMGAERHAHEVANAITDGGNARALLGSQGEAVTPAVRNYTEMTDAEQKARNEWKVGSTARVGDAGRTVTSEMQHECWADPALILAANDILAAKKSGIEIKAGAAGPSGNAPDGSGMKSLVEVVPTIKSSASGDDYWADCGRASREVQGPAGSDSAPRGVYNDGAGKRLETPTASYDPETFRDEIYVKGGLGVDPASARTAYLALSPVDKDAFDKKHGINKYAAPGVGESFVARRDDALSSDGFNWHWGAVIMVADPDRVTFENFAKPGTKYDTKDKQWYFESHGPPTKPGQTFHEHNASSVGAPGMNTTTMAARTSPDPVEVNALGTAELVRRHNAAAAGGEKMMLEAELRKREIKVTVDVKKAQETEDQVYVKVSGSGKEYETGWRKLKDGDSFTFRIPIDKVFPIAGHFNIKVYEYDTFSDDVISNIGWDPPYAPVNDARPWDDATYDSKVEFDR